MRFVYSEELWFEEELFYFYYIFGVDLVFFCRCGCDWVFLVIGRGIWYLVKGEKKNLKYMVMCILMIEYCVLWILKIIIMFELLISKEM